jgi:sortase (surface protein transpeptidase)
MTENRLSGRTLLAAAAALLVFGGLAGGGVVLASRPDRVLAAQVPTDPRVAPSLAAAVPQGFAPPVSAPPAEQHVPPVEVAVPSIGVRSKLIGLRLNNDGTLQVPEDYGIAGWYSDGPAPGDSGPPAVIVGHVDSKAGPGIFYRLPQLKKGDKVLVRRADGTDVRFTVYRTADYLKDAFPADKVYAARPSPELRLITCTGTFNQKTGHYVSNRVVYAKQSAA